MIVFSPSLTVLQYFWAVCVCVYLKSRGTDEQQPKPQNAKLLGCIADNNHDNIRGCDCGSETQRLAQIHRIATEIYQTQAFFFFFGPTGGPGLLAWSIPA